MRAVTRVKPSKPRKVTMHRPTRLPYRGRLHDAGEAIEWRAHSICRGMGTACQESGGQHGRPQGSVKDSDLTPRGTGGGTGGAERFVVPSKPGNAGGGKGPEFWTSCKRGEGQVIGGSLSNTEEDSETARRLYGRRRRSRLPFLCPVRQDLPRRHLASRLCPVPIQHGRAGCGWSGFRGHRGVWAAAVARGTGACAQAADLSTGPGPESDHTEDQRRISAAGHIDRARSSVQTAAKLVLEPIFEADLAPARMATVLVARRKMRWSRWQRCSARATRKSWMPTSGVLRKHSAMPSSKVGGSPNC